MTNNLRVKLLVAAFAASLALAVSPALAAPQTTTQCDWVGPGGRATRQCHTVTVQPAQTKHCNCAAKAKIQPETEHCFFTGPGPRGSRVCQ